MLVDYLEIKPQERERLAKHIREGRIIVGPWFVMPDEANLSGESLVRNLMLGHRITAEFGGKPMPNGFVSDIFSHVSQMPQIFRMFGIDSAYFYRGTPCADEQSEMAWEGADGTETLIIKAYPEVGYQDFMEYRDGTPEEIRAYEEAKIALATTPVLYGMDGNDHQPAKWDAPEAAERMNGIFAKTVARHSSWPEYLADLKAALGPDWAKDKGRKRYVGELRFPAKAGTWTGTSMGTGSSRPYLKQANDEIENLLARVAEPLHAWAVLSKAPHHQEFLGEAWKQLLLNHPHDSICGCSIDQAHRDMVYRFDQARLIGRTSVLESVQDVGDRIDTVGLGEDEWLVTVYNMAGAASGPVTAFTFEAPTAIVEKKRGDGLVPALVGADGKAIALEVAEVEHAARTDAFIYKTRGISPALRPRWDLVERYHVRAEASVPALGYASWRVAWLPEKAAAAKPAAAKAVKTDAKKRTMENEFLRLRVRDDGSIDLYDKATRTEYGGIHVFEDVGDAGNGWDHVYPTKDKVVLSSDRKARGRVRVTVEREGRLSAAMKVAMTLRVPEDVVESKGADGKRVTARARKTVAMPIETTFTLVAGARRVECRTVVDNVAKRHRLRVMLPSGRKAETWQGDSAFDIVTRDIALMDTTGWKQHQREEHVIKNFAAVSDGRAGLAVLSKGLNEATVRDDKERTLALTLFRSFAQTLNGVSTTDSLIPGRFEGEYAIEPFTPEGRRGAGGAPSRCGGVQDTDVLVHAAVAGGGGVSGRQGSSASCRRLTRRRCRNWRR